MSTNAVAPEVIWKVVRFVGDPCGYRIRQWVANSKHGWVTAERLPSGVHVRINLRHAYLIEPDDASLSSQRRNT